MANDDDSGSIYQAPTSETNVTPEGDEMDIFVGARYDSYYAEKFSACSKGAVASWHWPAFFLTTCWLLYRKMWAYSLIYWFVWPVSLSIIATIISIGQADAGSALLWYNVIYFGGYAVVGFILIPIFANRIYFRHANQKLAKVAAKFSSTDQQRLELARIGGTSKVVFVIVPFVFIALIGVLAAIAIPAYQDYTIRAQVSEGLTLSSGAKAAVSSYYFEAREFPANNSEAGLAAAGKLSGAYTSSVEIDYGRIEVVYGRQAHEALRGTSLFLAPDTQGDNVIWTCYSDSIADKHLPAACR